MSDTELILTALLRVLEGQRRLAELYDFLPEYVCDESCVVRGGENAESDIARIHRVPNPSGRHQESMPIWERGRITGGKVVEVYDTLEDLIRERLGKK